MPIAPSKYPGIYIERDDARDLYFALTVNEALDTLFQKPFGRLLLRKIDQSAPAHRSTDGYKVLIYPPTRREFSQAGYSHPVFGNMVQDGTPCTAAMTPRGDCDNANMAESQNAADDGSGTSCRLRWNSTITTLKLTGDRVPSFICLAHELIHAYHCLYGRRKPNTLQINHAQGGLMSIGEEEFYTVGVRGFENEWITENKIRGEWRLPLRRDYP